MGSNPKPEPKIKNLQQAKTRIWNTLLDLDFDMEKPNPVNKNRDFLIMTRDLPKTVFYCKYQKEWKLKDPFDKGTIYGTINKGLFKQYNFDYLVICHGNGKVYYTTYKQVENALEEGLTRETESQGETVINIPIDKFKRLEGIKNGG